MLAFEFGGPASPDRVARTARALDEAVRVTAPGLADGDITMEVSNFNMHGEIRAWTKPAEEAIAATIRFVEQPEKAIAKFEHGREVARKLARPLRLLAEEHAVLRKPRAKRPIKRVTVELADHLLTLAELPRASLIDSLRGGDVVVTPILRVGRVREGATVLARINVTPEKQGEIRVPPGLVDAFFDAAKVGGIFAVTVDVTWRRDNNGGLCRDLEEAVARGITPTEFTELPELIKQFQAEAPDAFADLDEVADNIHDL